MVYSFESVNRKELAVELVHNKFLPSRTGKKKVCRQKKCFYNRVLLRRPSREKGGEGSVYLHAVC